MVQVARGRFEKYNVGEKTFYSLNPVLHNGGTEFSRKRLTNCLISAQEWKSETRNPQRKKFFKGLKESKKRTQLKHLPNAEIQC